MPETVLFESESRQSRAAVADYLRSVADKLDAGDAVTLAAGEQSVTLDPPGTVAFEVKAERETGTGAPELSVEFELEWTEGESADEDLEIR
ncbi:MAG: amphi-Trp domain-containing protein [Halanaeroarchaeum sp.]